MELSENLGRDWDKNGTKSQETYGIIVVSETIICQRQGYIKKIKKYSVMNI